jgi:hypothetical protein
LTAALIVYGSTATPNDVCIDETRLAPIGNVRRLRLIAVAVARLNISHDTRAPRAGSCDQIYFSSGLTVLPLLR